MTINKTFNYKIIYIIDETLNNYVVSDYTKL